MLIVSFPQFSVTLGKFQLPSVWGFPNKWNFPNESLAQNKYLVIVDEDGIEYD